MPRDRDLVWRGVANIEHFKGMRKEFPRQGRGDAGFFAQGNVRRAERLVRQVMMLGNQEDVRTLFGQKAQLQRFVLRNIPYVESI